MIGTEESIKYSDSCDQRATFRDKEKLSEKSSSGLLTFNINILLNVTKLTYTHSIFAEIYVLLEILR